MTQITSERSSPERQREPHDGQSHHVFFHWVVEALHEIHIDLKWTGDLLKDRLGVGAVDRNELRIKNVN